MSSDHVITVSNFGKAYLICQRPIDRLKQFLWRGMGIIGRNGSGNSTLLQLICGTLAPTTVSIHVNGRVAVLLKLGASFNPEFTGREKV